jgi:hypothetical protein
MGSVGDHNFRARIVPLPRVILAIQVWGEFPSTRQPKVQPSSRHDAASPELMVAIAGSTQLLLRGAVHGASCAGFFRQVMHPCPCAPGGIHTAAAAAISFAQSEARVLHPFGVHGM